MFTASDRNTPMPLPGKDNARAMRTACAARGTIKPAMSVQDPLVRRDDLARAREIARKHAPFVGGDMLVESVAQAIAEGIAEGRERAVSNRGPG